MVCYYYGLIMISHDSIFLIFDKKGEKQAAELMKTYAGMQKEYLTFIP